MAAIGEENLYLEMDSNTEANRSEVYEDVAGGTLYAIPVTTQETKYKNQQPPLAEVVNALCANTEKLRRMMLIVVVVVVINFMITVGTLVLVVMMMKSENASSSPKEVATVQRLESNGDPTEMTKCDSSPCFHNGTCINRVDGFDCTCPPGLSGERCETDVNDCDSNPCLNNGVCFDRVSGFNCCCAVGFAGHRCEKVMRGLYYHLPAHSCKEILDLGVAKVDGEYWIDPEKSGKPLRVYCDMTTDGGGWLLISTVVTKGPSPPKVSVETSYRGISGTQMVLTKDAMAELRTHLSFTQLRFHCSKLQGRTFHVTTTANRSGEAVVQYFSGQTNLQPVSCGSFVRMEDDDSVLAGDCAKWGYERNSHFVGKWGHEKDQSRLYDHPAFLKLSYHWLIEPSGSRWECDDYLVGLSTGDFWKVFAR